MRALLVASLLIAASCGKSSGGSTPCPDDKKFCTTPVDGGCLVAQVVCCDGYVPACGELFGAYGSDAGSYVAQLPMACTTVFSEGCL